MQKYIDYLVEWIEDRRKAYKVSKYVIGVSGGIDSAVIVGLLAKTGTPFQPVLLPSNTTPNQDKIDAYNLLKQYDCTPIEVPIDPTYQTLIKDAKPLLNPDASRQGVILGNIHARLRMIFLYAYAQSNDALVVGTDNADEWYTGYFTKYGDGGVDIAPLNHLRKEQVYQVAKLLNIPQEIMNKAPSAGLWEGQTDEGEMGVTYAELDAFLRGEEVSEHAKERIAFWHDRSWHKRQMVDVPKAPNEI